MHRRSFFGIVPVGTWIGLSCLFGMALIAPMRPYIIYVAVAVIAWTVFALWQVITDIEASAGTPKFAQNPSEPENRVLGFEDVLQALPDPVMIIAGHEPDDIAGRWILFANAAARKTLHLEADGGLLVSAVRNPEVLECVDEALFGQINGTTIFETSGGARDQYWRAFSSPLPSGDEVNRIALLVMRDETDSRRMERMRADFLANASHELRTPLASLSGFIETLRGPARDDEKARDKFLNIMAIQADRMGRLIYDLLSLSRIEMNEHVPPSGEADLASVVRDVVDGLSLMARDKGVALTVNGPSPGLYRIAGDRDQLLQVVQNLVDNALKYAPAGSSVAIDIAFDLTLQAAVAARDPSAAKLVLLRPDRNVHDYYARVSVRDAGPGIRREHLPRLAERFYRVEGQKSGDKLGTGLGLAIVKHILNRHRGGLVVESQARSAGPDEDIALIDGKVAALPVTGPETFTAFSAYFPQKGVYGVPADGAAPLPQLATRDGERLDGERLKDAG